MTPKEQIEKELSRLREMVSKAKAPDPVDVAVVEALGSQEVQAALIPVLAQGAFLTGVVLEAAGTMAGVAHLAFDCDWEPGTSHLTAAPRVEVLIEVDPPKILKVATILSPEVSAGVRFTPPEGPIPPALRNMTAPSSSEALSFSQRANCALADWLVASGLEGRLGSGGAVPRKMDPPPTWLPKDGGGGGGGGGGAMGLTTGTKCTSLLCFERTSDDFDAP
jgi:hypothetical protein